MIGGSTAEIELAGLTAWADRAPAIAVAEREARMTRAQELTERLGADALLVNAGASLRYFSGLPWG
ncbi:aminopeptidase P family N-terminal domain-containing protein, partial [Novosphingobium sp.]|uniref:aminopeptidase P family N-terminal domain-containing protein n=2 Tax=unclassified Novosphingobium TaxID=2644732 RepID=UPI0039184B7C